MSNSHLTLLTLLALCQVKLSWQMTTCGDCMCEKAKMSCSLKNYVRAESLADVMSVSTLSGVSFRPEEITEIYINCFNKFGAQRLTRQMLAPYIQVETVEILRCNLTEIDSNALTSLENLKKIDFSGNDLSRVSPRLFDGLQLSTVSLSLNRRLSFDEDSFAGSTIDKLIISESNITEFPLASLIKIKELKHLSLSSNKIRTVPRDALKVVNKLDSFYIDNNPLLCTCRNKWMLELLDWNRLVPTSSMRDRKRRLPTCYSPFTLNGIELTKVNSEMLACATPHVDSVRLLVDGQRASLDCSAWLDEEEERRSLTWTMQPNAGVELRAGQRFTAALSKQSAVDTFVIGVRSADGKASSLNLTVRWPEEIGVDPSEPKVEAPTPPLSDSTKVVAGGGSGKPQVDYFAQKQFTLVEMIVAVIGTFMATTLVFLLSCQFTRWYSKRDKKRWAVYNSHPYSATYNPHQASSHEYDVPRIDQPCLPKPSAEFLDFNNPRVMYNA